jgi:ABC-type uncharacterized transport system substrate-binding protein
LINLCMAWTLLAHPHVFIDYTTDFIFDEKGLIGIEVEWYFDEMYSSMLLQDYDANKDRLFSNEEIVITERDAFSNLKNYNYFIYITKDDEMYKVNTVKDFSAEVREDKVVYKFFVPYAVLVRASYQDIVICMYDETYYVDLWPLNDDPARFTNAEHIEYKYKVFEDEKQSQGYGQIYPYSIRLTFRKKES